MNKVDQITEIRGFNRFYTNILGLLNQSIYDSEYSLTECRILFEIRKLEHCTANQLCSLLDVDRSYMSRIITKFEKKGLITRQMSSVDSRHMEIHMTEKGMEIYEELSGRSDRQIEGILNKLDHDEQKQLCDAMKAVKKYMTIATADLRIRHFRERDVDYIIERQLSLYATERHFTSDIWVKYLTEGVHALVDKFDPEKDCMYILEFNGNPAGCVAITNISEDTAQFRYFFLEPEVRGLGAGKKLVDAALNFCREKKYAYVFLWTVSAQEAARKLYADAGFVLTETCPNEEWGVPVLEERWDLKL